MQQREIPGVDALRPARQSRSCRPVPRHPLATDFCSSDAGALRKKSLQVQMSIAWGSLQRPPLDCTHHFEWLDFRQGPEDESAVARRLSWTPLLPLGGPRRACPWQTSGVYLGIVDGPQTSDSKMRPVGLSLVLRFDKPGLVEKRSSPYDHFRSFPYFVSTRVGSS